MGENNMPIQYPTAPPAPCTPMPPIQPITTAPTPNACLVRDLSVPETPIPPSAGLTPSSTTYAHGLEYLTTLDQLFLMQDAELLQAFTEFERKNKYCVVNVRGERVFYVVEDSTKCARCCWEPSSRPCKLEVFDNSRKEILRMVLPCRCHSGCCFCCPQEMEVYSGDTLLGTVTENWSSWRTSFSVRDAPRETVLTIKGPWCESSSNLEFQVRPADGEHKVGDIKKQWSGLGTELFTNADHFGINFPLDLDVKMKALLLGACLLIDLMYVKETADDCMETVGPGCELLRLIVECITCIQCMAE